MRAGPDYKATSIKKVFILTDFQEAASVECLAVQQCLHLQSIHWQLLHSRILSTTVIHKTSF